MNQVMAGGNWGLDQKRTLSMTFAQMSGVDASKFPKDIPITVTDRNNDTYYSNGASFIKNLNLLENASIIVIGGDHPYVQWYGSNGNDGLAQMYLDRGFLPYCAICWDDTTRNNGDVTSGIGASLKDISYPGNSNPVIDLMNTTQALYLQNKGVEFTSHALRHPNDWSLINTGIRIAYSGVASAPTVYIQSTGVTLTGNGGAENVTLTWASYPTLNDLFTAINAISGSVWKCYLAGELDGTESTKLLVPITAARNVVATSDGTLSVQRFALNAGIRITYTGTAYKHVYAQRQHASNFLYIFGDGVAVAAINISTGTPSTLSGLVTTINGLSISGLSAALADNGWSTQSPKIRETYCWGDELSINLHENDYVYINGRGGEFSIGYDRAYVVKKLVKKTVELAATYGINLKNFSQPGGNFHHWLVNSALDHHDTFRIGTALTGQDSPTANPVDKLNSITDNIQISTSYDNADTKAILDAAADSPGFYIDVLMHKLLPDGTTNYTLTNADNYYDQTESNFVDFLNHLKSLRDSGQLRVMSPTQAAHARRYALAPKNYIFNPLFKNNGKSLVGLTTNASGANGRYVPGWRLQTNASYFSAVSVSDGEITFVTNGAIGATIYALSQYIFLQPGKTYEIGMLVDTTGVTSAYSVNLQLYLFSLMGRVAHNMIGSEANALSAANIQPGACREARMTFTVPMDQSSAVAEISGATQGPYNLSSNHLLTVGWDGLGLVSDIDVQGATPSATTAQEVCNKINAAVAANSNYANWPEYWNIATVVNNKVVIRAPYNRAGATNQYITVVNGSSGSALATIFGSSTSLCRAYSRPSEDLQSSIFGYQLSLGMGNGYNGTIKVKAPYCREVRY